MARTLTVSDEEIFAAAEQVIGRCGPDGFTLSEVATKVGLTRAAINLRFKSAHDLKVTVLTRAVDQFVEELAGLPKTPSGDSLLKVAAFIGAHIGSRESFSTFYATYSSNVIDPDLSALNEKRAQALFKAVSVAMPKTPLSIDSAAHMFLASLTGDIIFWQNTNADVDANSFLVKQMKEWLRLARIPFGKKA